MAKEGEKGYRIYIKDGVPLNSSDKEACAYVGADPDKLKEAKKKDEHLDEKFATSCVPISTISARSAR